MSLRGHYTQVRFGPQVALPHRFARPIRRMYSKWYRPLVVQPKFTRRGKHSLTSSHLRQARTPPLDLGRRRGTVSFGPALPTGVDFQGSPPPGCVLASISSKALHPIGATIVHNGSPENRGALPREHWRPDQHPPVRGPHTLVVAPRKTSATAMARASRGVQIVKSVVMRSCAH